jgi:hypothetical protein
MQSRMQDDATPAHHAAIATQTAGAPHTGRPAATAAESTRGVTFRVVLLCLALALFFAYAIPVIDYKFFNTFLGATHLPPGALAVLLILLLVVNPLLGLLSRRFRFSRNEILTIYISCLISCLVPGIGGNNYFVSFIIGSFYFATRENQWFEFLKGLPPWFTPALNPDGSYNRYVVESWYTGLGPGEGIPWTAWLVPLAAWGALFMAIFGMQACLAVMLRAQWGEREALAFPMLRLPLELSEDVDRDDKYGVLGRFFRSPLMWCGFGIAVFIQGLNGLNVYWPDWPPVPLSLDTGQLFTEAPWNQIGWTPLRIFPLAVGITYLLSAEVSFSLWFFYWLVKFQFIGAYYLGFPPNSLPNTIGSGQKIFTGYQEVGAHLAFVAIIFWTGREHFQHIWRRATLRERARESEKTEALSYPVAFWGFVLSFAFLVAWTVAAGVTPTLAVVLWISYLVLAIVLSRVVAEGGLLFVHHGWMPLGAFAQLLGSGPGTWMSPANGIVPAAVIEASCIQDYRGSLMPSFVQGFKLAHDRKINSRHLFLLLFAVILVGMVVGIHMNVRLGYENSGLQLQGWLSKSGPQMTGSNVRELSQSARDMGWTNWFWLGSGGLITYGIMLARSRFSGFPLHPIGYMMCLTYPMHMLWFSVLLGWLSKVLITRFGGIDTYRKTVPLFLGLALGDVAMMLFWVGIDAWQGRTGHQLMPG